MKIEEFKWNWKRTFEEMTKRQKRDFYNSSFEKYKYINDLFEIINTLNCEKADWFYQGTLYRVHIKKNNIKYLDDCVAFSKKGDFWNRKIWYKIPSNEICTIIKVDTKDKFGIDVNEFYKSYLGKEKYNSNEFYNNRFENENEVLFPLKKEYIETIYKTTPLKFKEIINKGE